MSDQDTGLGLVHSCSYTEEEIKSDYIRTYASCWANATYYKSCTCGESSKGDTNAYFTATGTQLTHEYTSNVVDENYRASYATCTASAKFYKSCPNCGGKGTATFSNGIALGHDYTYSQLEVSDPDYLSRHRATCQRSGCNYTYTPVHDKGKLEPLLEGNVHYDTKHDVRCSKCNQFRETVEHTWKGGDGLNGTGGVHKCGCGHEHKTPYHYFPEVFKGDDMSKNAACPVCGQRIWLYGTFAQLNGLILEKYVAADASISMEDVPEIKNQEYDLSWRYLGGHSTGELVLSKDGINAVTTAPDLPKDWITLEQWGRKTIREHIESVEDIYDTLLEQYFDYGADPSNMPFADSPIAQDYAYTQAMAATTTSDAILYLTMLGDITPYFGMTLDEIKESVSEDYSYFKAENPVDYVTQIHNIISEKELEEWNDAFKFPAQELIKLGGPFEPTVTINGNAYTIDYTPLTSGGWYFQAYPFASAGSDFDTELFRNGELPDTQEDEWYGNVYYCFRTTKNEVPKNGYLSRYTYSNSVVIYRGGPIDQTVSISLNSEMKNLIDKTGYRYVGWKAVVGPINGVGAAAFGSDYHDTTTASATIGWDHTRSAAQITFFVEPVKLSYGHKAIDYNKNIININATSHQGEGLEFPDYYDTTAGKCIIPADTQFNLDPDPLESLYKYAWPGYILKSARTFKDGTNFTNKKFTDSYIQGRVISGSEIEYDENETTNIDGNPPRPLINERVPSFYASESRGFASDKEFYFFYDTPTIAIEHKDFKTNGILKDKNGKDIVYLQQIINQYAYIESLITDNVKPEYTLKASLASGGTEVFTYKYPKMDLVQIKISEVKEDGSLKHYATLYYDEKYKPSSKAEKVEDYSGVFEKYYSESLDVIAEQIGKSTQVFNTNKNWKVEFFYDEVERVYIKFKDLKGNSIFIEQPEGSGKYIGEITEKIPTGGFSYPTKNLGENGRFTLVKYTEGTDGYITDLNQASDISAGTSITASSGAGDRYFILYYSTGKTLTVEYRDELERNIRPNTTLEIPTTGTVVEVPTIKLYEIIGYKHNPNYDLVGHQLTKYFNGNTIPAGTTIYGINGDDVRVLTVDDKEVAIPNPDETNHHIIIYYKSKAALKVEYRDINGDKPIPVPPQYMSTTIIEIPETGTQIEVPTVPGYKPKYYLKNEAYNGTDTTISGSGIDLSGVTNIPVPSNGNNQFIIIYYEKIAETTDLIIEYREYIEGTPVGPEIQPPVTIQIPNGTETPISIPDIEDYIPKAYTKNGDPETIIPEGTKPTITIVGDPNVGPQKIIIEYVKSGDTPDPEEPEPGETIITPDDNIERVYLKANEKGNEEYDTEIAIPTSEDLYVSGDVYAYRYVTEMEKKNYTETIDIEIRQQYYEDLDKPSETDYIPVLLEDYELTYKYYDILKAELYDLKALHLDNDAIKYYNDYNFDAGTFDGYKEGEANFPVSDATPYLEYVVPTGVATANPNARVQIDSADGYDVKYENGKYIITILDVDYYPGVNRTAVENQIKNEAQAIIEKCTKIKVQTLKIKLNGESDVDILTGKTYELSEKAEALDSTEYYIPYVAGRTPLESFNYNRDLYVREGAENRLYTSTMTGDYRLVQSIPVGGTTISTHNPINGTKLTVEKINVNSLNVHTPIVNKATLTPSEDNIKASQLALSVKDTLTNTTILNLEKQFTIEIPNNEGAHIDSKGYGDNKAYNHKGLMLNGTEINNRKINMNYDNNNFLMSGDIILNTAAGAVINQASKNFDTEEKAVGPSFAEYKLIRFPYDVYLLNPDSSLNSGKPQLFKANEWYNLYSYVRPATTSYTFVIPTWVKDATLYSEANGIQVLVVAENAPLVKIEEAMHDPMAVKSAESNETGKNNTYILRKTFNTYVSGRLYDLQIRDTDDPGYMGKVRNALKGDKTSLNSIIEMPIAQNAQVSGYNMGLKLGYRFYFDIKTKGISNEKVSLQPKLYYVSPTGAITSSDDLTFFYHTKGTLYKKLNVDDLRIRMIMTGTHGQVNNPTYTSETITAKKLNPNRVLTNQSIIGNVYSGVVLNRNTEKLPYNDLAEIAKACGFNTDLDSFIASAIDSETLTDDIETAKNEIQNATGRWYGEYYLPASTIVVNLANATKEQAINPANVLTNGYLVVIFEEVTTEDDVKPTGGYLTYSAPADTGLGQQWEKEGIETTIRLPNGREVTIPVANATSAAPMAIYQVGLRANNDYEPEGTH